MEYPSIQSILTYLVLFIATYFEVFLVITLLENSKKLGLENTSIGDKPVSFPTATIIIPCFNEESTVDDTVKSLLEMNYPQDKFNVVIVDDGSTDKTWQHIQKYSSNSQIKVYRKENGGKYTALNYGIKQSTTDLVGCLDADSFVHKDALRRMVKYFENPEIMAVTPAIKIFKPKSVIQCLQYIEYQLGIMIKKILSYLSAIHVAPGPFTIFRRDVFRQIGLFRHAHNTEDMEIAMRMHKHHLKIDNCHKAFIYTIGPNTLKKLYRQRVRWTHGFIENVIDYKDIFFRKEYGNIAFLTLPFSAASLVGVATIVSLTLLNFAKMIYNFFVKIAIIGFHPHFNFDLSFIYVSTKTSLFIGIALISMTMALLMIGRKISEEKILSKEVFYFLILYPLVAPLWIGKSIYNTVLSKKTNWR
jgi:cellulose synthase/poly-beta-1,6-N-acetylglucosamine synthase-like glycosyltransferase